MKEELWSIRKMREQQKFSNSRNTYKQNDQVENSEFIEVIQQKRVGLIKSIFTRFQLFLEE